MGPSKRFRKSETQKVLLGVCGGLAEYFNVDPVPVRLLFVASAFFGLLGVAVYLILAIAMPKAGPPSG